jgi:ribose transport system substrate-binding protein
MGFGYNGEIVMRSMLKQSAWGVLAGLSLLVGCDEKPAATATTPSASTNAATAPATTPAASSSAASTPAATPAAAPAATPAAGKKKFTFGVIAKSQSNPVFIAAKNGAMAAGRDFSKDGVQVEVLWQTPATEDAQKQAEFITQLANSGVDGIAVSVTDAKVLTSAIDSAVAQGVPVVCFDSDAPASKRMAIYGMDDVDAGKELARQLVKFMGEKGAVAILAGNQNATNLQARVRGVKEELAKFNGITVKDVYYHVETAPEAVAKIKSVQGANPDITGWAFVGGWPLYTDNALQGVADKGVTVVSIDTLPLPLGYVAKGEVKSLVGQDYFGWGYESVRMLLDKAKDGKSPANPVVRAKVDIVTKDNAAEFGKVWQEKWLKE